MSKKTLLETAKDVMSGRTTADRVAAVDNPAVSATPKVTPKPKVKAYTPPQNGQDARNAAIEKARLKDEKDIAEMLKKAADAKMDSNMQEGLTKHKARKMAKGGKVRGCGIAKRGLGRGTRSR